MITLKQRDLRREISGKLIFLSIAIGPIAMTPWWNFDPINLPRLYLVVLVGSLMSWLGLLNQRNNFSKLYFRRHALPLFLIVLCIFFMTISFFFSGPNLTMQFYGTQGRNTGYLAYASLMLLLLGFTLSSPQLNSRSLKLAVGFSGISNLLYGVAQSQGIDFVDWQNPYGPVVGMLGNPNFISAFMGLFAIFLASLLFWKQQSSLISICALATLICSLYLIMKTNSIQGIFVFMTGLFTLIFMRINLKSRISLLLVPIFFFSVSVASLGLAGKGPLGDFLFQSTLKVRYFFWTTAWKMTMEKPLLGFGWDSFGDWYRSKRGPGIIELYGPGLTTNSAHNMFLDIGVSGGAICMLLMFFTCLWIVYRGIRYKIVVKEVSWILAASFSIWIGFLSQTLISVNNLAIALWGFTFGGLVICMTNSQFEVNTTTERITRNNSVTIMLGFSLIIATVSIIVIPALYNDAKFRQSLVSARGDEVIRSVERFPQSDFRLTVAARIFYRNSKLDLADNLAREAISINPRNREAWASLLLNPSLSIKERDLIKLKLKELDPYMPNE